VRWLDKQLPMAIDRAQAILVDSEFVRNEVLTTFGVDAARVHTAHLGVSTDFRPRNLEETRLVLDAMGLRRKGYVLSVATIEPRKNLRHVVESFARLPSALRERFPLVIAGATGWQSSNLVDQLRHGSDGQVRFFGQVDSAVLPHLYSGAALFVFPSLYEGFGLPPLEAMASGVPVLVSNRASLPEVVGDAGEMIDPLDPTATADKLRALLEDSAARSELARRGLTRASHFTWAECASVTHSVYQSVLGKPRAGEQVA
jgi:alpha-1,3-rhamnosyl/mannosyltransferase